MKDNVTVVYEKGGVDPAPVSPEPVATVASPAEPEKVCPDCAETVKAAANVCRFCGSRFDAQPS
jgi:hypothetical protein